MRHARFLLLLLCWTLGTHAHAAAPDDPATPAKKRIFPHPVTTPWYVKGIETPERLSAVRTSLEKVPRFRRIEVVDGATGLVDISFDSHFTTYHQIAQAIADADGRATLKFTIPDYAKDDHAAKIDGLMREFATQVEFETIDRQRGEFVVHFLPLERDPSNDGPQGFNLGHLKHKVADALPKGLGLTFLYEVHTDKDN